MVDYYAVQALEIPAEIALLNSYQAVPKVQWRAGLPQLDWAQYDELIEQVSAKYSR